MLEEEGRVGASNVSVVGRWLVGVGRNDRRIHHQIVRRLIAILPSLQSLLDHPLTEGHVPV